MNDRGYINVLLVEDSIVSQELLAQLIEKDPALKIMGKATSAEEALVFLKANKPDVISIDINLPGMDGYQLTEKIMKTHPVPIVIISGLPVKEDVHNSFRAIDAGAICILEKPVGPKDPGFAKKAEMIRNCLKTASKSYCGGDPRSFSTTVTGSGETGKIPRSVPRGKIRCVAIGGSMGGPGALRSIFSKLPSAFPVPIFVVQHISPGFVKGLSDWLQQATELSVVIAKDLQKAEPGTVYLAPDKHHMLIDSRNIIHLDPSCKEREIQPSVSRLFGSVLDAHGEHSIAVLLTGMGCDGAKELLQLKQKGAKTIAQDRATSVIFGMPSEAINLGGACYITPLDEIAGRIVSLL